MKPAILKAFFNYLCFSRWPNYYVDEYHWRGYTFPVAIKTINGVEVRYVVGLVAITTNPNVTIEQLQPLIKEFDGKILDSWQPTGTKELEITMRIPFASDPFKVANQLNRSSLIRSAAPVFLSTPE